MDLASLVCPPMHFKRALISDFLCTIKSKHRETACTLEHEIWDNLTLFLSHSHSKWLQIKTLISFKMRAVFFFFFFKETISLTVLSYIPTFSDCISPRVVSNNCAPGWMLCCLKFPPASNLVHYLSIEPHTRFQHMDWKQPALLPQNITQIVFGPVPNSLSSPLKPCKGCLCCRPSCGHSGLPSPYHSSSLSPADSNPRASHSTVTVPNFPTILSQTTSKGLWTTWPDLS